MKKNNKENEYSVVSWSFIRFILVNWRIWITLIIIIYGFFFIGKTLNDNDFFSEVMIQQEKMNVLVQRTRTTPNSSVLIINPFDQSRIYELNMGLNCKLMPDIVNRTYNVNVLLYKRNYNNTFYIKIPEIKNFICENQSKDKTILDESNLTEKNTDLELYMSDHDTME